MSEQIPNPQRLQSTIEAVLASIDEERRFEGDATWNPPDALGVAWINERLRWLAFPGFFGRRNLTSSEMREDVAGVLQELADRLEIEVARAFAHEGDTSANARDVVMAFLQTTATVRGKLRLDEQAAFGGDPAAHHVDEAILCHPGIRALAVHRFAHELHRLGVPLLPRMMSTEAHTTTGIDIHPGAEIGDGFFIDHGTGVVIGETTVIGNRCTLYQGVTLGAAFFERTEDGSLRRGYKRHPTLEDDVTVYAGATILGGETVIGRGSTINGGVFLRESVPANSIVSGPRLEIHLRSREPGQ